MRFRHIAIIATLAVFTPATARSQIGGLVRRAKEAAATKVVENKNLKPSSAFGPELTEQSLNGVLRGLAAAQASLDSADQLRVERQRIDAELSKSYQAHDKEREKYQELARSTERCQDSVTRERGASAQAAYMQRMQSNPAEQAKMMQAAVAVTQKVAAAQQRGDSAEVRRLMTELVKAQGMDPKADSAFAIKTCGAVPQKPAWLAQQESARDRSQSIDGRIREFENGAGAAGAKASSMSVREYSMARERVLHWYLENQSR
ncbi:MAG TPA: hypothetical protein VIP11_13795, partial [Gemmatimonadaceae bacterium]